MQRVIALVQRSNRLVVAFVPRQDDRFILVVLAATAVVISVVVAAALRAFPCGDTSRAEYGGSTVPVSSLAATAASEMLTATSAIAASRQPGSRQPGSMQASASPSTSTSVPVPGSQPTPSLFSQGAQLRRARVFAAMSNDEAFVQLGEPRCRDWLAAFPEPGQMVGEYAAELSNRKTRRRTTLHLLPFSDLDRSSRRQIEVVREFVATYFDTRVVVLPTRAPDPRWYVAARDQYNADLIVNDLAREVPGDSLGLFGLMASDLYGIDLGWVFGEALLARRAAVYSTWRMREPTALFRQRLLKVTAHEIGHMFGLAHCVFYRCIMNGSNSLSETDGSPIHLCPVCLAKLRWNLRFDTMRRYRALGTFYQRIGFTAEARFARQRASWRI
ncbi:MAG: archaemetzincin [Pseudomonadota bacterium]